MDTEIQYLNTQVNLGDSMLNPSRASYTCTELNPDSSATRSSVINVNMREGMESAYVVELIKAL